MKKTIAIIVLVLLSIFMFLIFRIDVENADIYINWGIYLPKANKINTIYHFDFRAGHDFSILIYNDKKIDKIISKNNFKVINQDNRGLILEKIMQYYNLLNDDNKKLFEDNIDIDQLLNVNEKNYYLFKEKNNDDFIILIASEKENKIYYLYEVW